MKVIKSRTRKVFIGTNWVYKKSLNSEGYIANLVEAGHTDSYVPVAECYLLNNGMLKMRKVNVWNCGMRCPLAPSWVQSVDCAQVGFSQGKLVAYDL